MSKYTKPVIRTKEDTKFVRITTVNGNYIPLRYSYPYIWERVINDSEAIFIFNMETTECYVYTKEFYEECKELKNKYGEVQYAAKRVR